MIFTGILEICEICIKLRPVLIGKFSTYGKIHGKNGKIQITPFDDDRLIAEIDVSGENVKTTWYGRNTQEELILKDYLKEKGLL